LTSVLQNYIMNHVCHRARRQNKINVLSVVNACVQNSSGR